MIRWDGYLGAGLVVLFLVGVGIGWWSGARSTPDIGAPESQLEGQASALAKSAPSTVGKPPLAPEAANRALLEALAASDDSRSQAGLLRLMARFSPNPEAMVGMIIDAMSEKELAIAIASFSSISPKKIQEASNPREFTHRLAELAMQDLMIVQPDGQGAPQNVLFWEETASDEPVAQGFQTLAGEGRIRATFPMGSYQEDEVFVKWVRLDDPKIMLFNHYPIRAEADTNYVWLEPGDGWEKGEYQVNFYTADESLSPLSGGRYFVD